MRARRLGESLVVLGLALGCEGGQSSGADAKAVAAAPTEASAEAAAPARPRSQPPLPAFSGFSLDGKLLGAKDFLGKRLVIFFFDASRPAAAFAARAIAAIAPLRGKENFQILGIASRAAAGEAKAFVERHGLEFPVIDDASGALARRFGLESGGALLFADAEGYVVGALGADADEHGDAARTLEAALRRELRLPADAPALLEPALGEYPLAPDFAAARLEGGETFRLAQTRGRPLVLMFFLYTCPHCHKALESLRAELPKLPEASRPALVGISIAGSPDAVRQDLATRKLDFFPVLVDPDGALRTRYAVLGGVPDLLLIDAQGRIRARSQGWEDQRDPPLLRMRLAALAGQPVPMLLRQSGYSGNDLCGVCHEAQHETWRFTAHGHAYDTLVRHGAERDAECVGCHVVGLGQPGGFQMAEPEPWLEGVGCESCHGRGGPHLSPAFAPGHDYRAACATCHDAKHSLGFAYESFLPRISHAANAGLLALSPEEKRARVAALGAPRAALFPDAPFVGSDACRSCHEVEWKTWSEGPHGRAMASLAAKGRTRDADCLRCHTTGFGRAGGFPTGGDPAAHADLARVGCESCHGPGGAHVVEGARRAGTIVSLGDKCDSCVILQICGACHDAQNDPGFEFAVKDKIDRQRHGTIEPGGKPKAADADAGRLEAVDRVERALAAAGL